jgi:hypothetical protein
MYWKNYLPPGGEYQLMLFGGKTMEGGREKDGKCKRKKKKRTKGKKWEERGRKGRNGRKGKEKVQN